MNRKMRMTTMEIWKDQQTSVILFQMCVEMSMSPRFWMTEINSGKFCVFILADWWKWMMTIHLIHVWISAPFHWDRMRWKCIRWPSHLYIAVQKCLVMVGTLPVLEAGCHPSAHGPSSLMHFVGRSICNNCVKAIKRVFARDVVTDRGRTRPRSRVPTARWLSWLPGF